MTRGNDKTIEYEEYMGQVHISPWLLAVKPFGSDTMLGIPGLYPLWVIGYLISSILIIGYILSK